MQKLKSRKTFLLVIPRLVQRIGDGYSFPLGIPYVSASLKQAGYNVVTLNLNHHEGTVEAIMREFIFTHGVDVVATGGLSFQYNTIREVIETAKRISPSVITVVGGGIITSDPETAMLALEHADFGVIGEGEHTIREFAATLERDGAFEGVNGLIYDREGKLHKTDPRKEEENIDIFPWPDYVGFDLDKYLATSPSISGLNESHTVFMIASRSCPYNCTFCFHTTGRHYRMRSLDDFFQELEHMIATYKINFITLADELFGIHSERMKEFCSRIKGYGVRWWAQFRVDRISEELMPLLKEAGCAVMSFGLESADNRVLKSMRKGTTIEQIETALQIVYDSGISLEGAFIFGDIAETWETANNTMKWWREHAHYKINLNLITVFPGSALYQEACRRGVIADRVKYLRDGCPQVNISQLTNQQYAKLVRMIMEAPMEMVKTLDDLTLVGTNHRAGRVDLAGTCVVCGHQAQWTQVKLFSTNFLGCPSCGQRYNIGLPAELRKIIDENVKSLIACYGKIAAWGINYHSADLFRNSSVLLGQNVLPVDISTTKQMMDLYGRPVWGPEILSTEQVAAVVVLIPAYFNQIDARIRKEFPGVQTVIDICDLLLPGAAKRLGHYTPILTPM